MTKLLLRLYHAFMNKILPFKHYLILICYGGSPYDLSFNGSLFDIQDRPPMLCKAVLTICIFDT